MRKHLILTSLLLSSLFGASAQTGTWSGKIEVQGMKLPLVFHLTENNSTMDSPDQGARDIPITVERSATGQIVIKIPSIGASYEGLWLGKQIVGTFKQWGSSLPLTLTPGKERVNRPQTPKGPFPYATEEVSFANGDAILKGTLVLPEGCTRKTPVLIMVTGSGFQNRDEEIFEHKPFAVIADALARAGVATLRYDDRGFGASSGDLVNCTSEDLKNDALAGIRLLRERFDKVGVLGHSEGGTIALLLAAEGKADFIVSLAGNVVSGAETLLWQNRIALSGAGVPAETVDIYCNALGEAFEARMSGRPMPSAGKYDLPDALKQNLAMAAQQLQTPYMKHFLALDARPVLGGIACPVLALAGSKDLQVEPGRNLDALRNGLGANPRNRIECLEGLNHLFQPCVTGAVTEYKEIEVTFAPEALQAVVNWLSDLRLCFRKM